MDPTNPLSQQHLDGGRPGVDRRRRQRLAGRIGGLAVDPSDPSGNTVYVGGASGGVWKTTNFLTTDPNGPTYIPLTDFGPTIGDQHRRHRRLRPQQRPEPVDHLRRHRRGRHRHRRASASCARWTAGRPGRCSTAPTTSTPRQPAADHSPRATTRSSARRRSRSSSTRSPRPTGEVIVYAALSGSNGGIWRSVDTGQDLAS